MLRCRRTYDRRFPFSAAYASSPLLAAAITRATHAVIRADIFTPSPAPPLAYAMPAADTTAAMSLRFLRYADTSFCYVTFLAIVAERF